MEQIQSDVPSIYNTNASDSLRSQLFEVLDFLADFHTLSKIKVISFLFYEYINFFNLII